MAAGGEIDFDEVDDVGVADFCRDVITLYKIDCNSTAMTRPDSAN